MTRPVTAADLATARALLDEGDLDAFFHLADTLADATGDDVQSALAAMLRVAGGADPEALSVFLAANAFRLPRTTVAEAARALPEAS